MAYDEGKGYWFFLINHTKLNYIAVADYCQSNYVEYNYNLITKTNRRKNYAGMVDKLSQLNIGFIGTNQLFTSFILYLRR